MALPNFQHHPDGLIYVRAADGRVYADTVENFVLDVGESYALPAGRAGRYYEPDVCHFLDNEPQNLKWHDGDKYIRKIDNLLDAQAARNVPPEPTPEELALEQLRLEALARIKASTNAEIQDLLVVLGI